MKKFTVYVPVFATATYEVEAETKEEAIQNVFDNEYPSLCWHCSKQIELGDFDCDRAEAEEQ